jgi:pseudouridine kinase
VAENLAHLGAAPRLLSVVGEDAAGKDLLAAASRAGIDISLCQVLPGRATATYVAVLSAAGDLVLGLADMALFDALQPAWLAAAWPALSTAQWLFAECNLPAQTVGWLARRCREEGKWLAVDAVSVAKSARLPANLQGISLLFLNLDQARALTGLAGSGRHEQTLMIAALRHRGVAAVMLTSGGGGVLVGAGDTVTHVPAVPVAVVDVTGACNWRAARLAAPPASILAGRMPSPAVTVMHRRNLGFFRRFAFCVLPSRILVSFTHCFSVQRTSFQLPHTSSQCVGMIRISGWRRCNSQMAANDAQ